MPDDDLRRTMDQWWTRANADALASKDSMQVLQDLRGILRTLSSDERDEVDEVICEWVLSSNEGKRYDARVLINEFSIRSAVPYLQKLESQLLTKRDPGAPFELQRVRQILARLQNGG